MTTPTQRQLTELIEQAQQRLQSPEPTVASAPAGTLADAATIAALIDHTLLKPEATAAQIRQLCADAATYGFASVCVNPTWISLCAELLAGTTVKTCTVAGFPLGATLGSVKAREAEECVRLGAREIDMVLNVGRLKSGDYPTVYADVAGVVAAAHPLDALVKVIIEIGLLTEAEKVAATVLVQAAGADFVKTATGFNGGGATVPDVALLRRVVGPAMGVKAAGGVRTGADAQQMVAAGATRIGTSGGVRILHDLLTPTGGVSPAPTSKDSY
jgi:deoxyribose-phosphate aldolase